MAGHGPDLARTTTSGYRNHVGEKATTTVGHALVAELVAQARRDPALADFSANKVSRIVRAQVKKQQERGDIVYLDPTGENAARNVDRARR